MESNYMLRISVAQLQNNNTFLVGFAKRLISQKCLIISVVQKII